MKKGYGYYESCFLWVFFCTDYVLRRDNPYPFGFYGLFLGPVNNFFVSPFI